MTQSRKESTLFVQAKASSYGVFIWWIEGMEGLNVLLKTCWSPTSAVPACVLQAPCMIRRCIFVDPQISLSVDIWALMRYFFFFFVGVAWLKGKGSTSSTLGNAVPYKFTHLPLEWYKANWSTVIVATPHLSTLLC